MKNRLTLIALGTLLLGVVIGLPACSVGEKPRPASPFDYNALVPFATKIVSRQDRDGVTVTDLNYSAHDPAFSPMTGGRTIAYLVQPPGQGPFAGIIYLHWLGNVTGNRSEFLDEAVETARHGAVCLVLQGYFPWMASPLGTQADHPLMVGQAVELRRAVDFLLAQPGVDPKRLGYVGHDYGAVYGGILAGIDPRLKTYVLVAGVPSFADWISFFHIAHDPYVPIARDIDPVGFVARAAPASLLFQFGRKDSFVPSSLATRFYAAASQPKQIEWFDDIHEMGTAEVARARLAWLVEQLGLVP
ncbi:MAG TPA: hypothetical protein VMC09_06590 [Anaerolineales bacterium]|nr:hypothetical protein [Anaerolineales bacterium]